MMLITKINFLNYKITYAVIHLMHLITYGCTYSLVYFCYERIMRIMS